MVYIVSHSACDPHWSIDFNPHLLLKTILLLYINFKGFRIDGEETGGAYIGDLQQNLEMLSGQWAKWQQPSFNWGSPWNKSRRGKKNQTKKTNKIKIVNQYSCHHSQSETCGDTSHSLPCLGSGHCRGRFEFKDVKNASCPPTFSRMSLTLYVLK